MELVKLSNSLHIMTEFSLVIHWLHKNIHKHFGY